MSKYPKLMAWIDMISGVMAVRFLATTTLSTTVILDAPHTYRFTAGFKC